VESLRKRSNERIKCRKTARDVHRYTGINFEALTLGHTRFSAVLLRLMERGVARLYSGLLHTVNTDLKRSLSLALSDWAGSDSVASNYDWTVEMS